MPRTTQARRTGKPKESEAQPEDAPKKNPAASKRKAEKEEPAVEIVEAPTHAVKRQRKEPQPLRSVSHPSHGKEAGGIWVMGDGDCGQLGLGEDVTEKTRPFPLSLGGKKVLQVAAGGMHTLALTEDGQVWSWGVNDEGALGRETAGELWQKSGQATGQPGDPYVPGLVPLPGVGQKVVQITAGDSHSMALTDLGYVLGWGTFRDGSGVMGFAAGKRVQLTPVSVHASGRDATSQVVQIASGSDHVLALTAGGTVLSWGCGQQGQLGRVGPRLSDRARLATLLAPAAVPIRRRRGSRARVASVAAGTYSSFAVMTDGSVAAWGLNNYGQLGLPGQEPVHVPTLVKDLPPVAAVQGGQHHTLALPQDGKGLLSFGRPTYGRLGRSDVDAAADSALPDPMAVDGLDPDAQIAGMAAGLAVSGCFDTEGTAWLWGFGTNNQLGKGDDDSDETVPAKLPRTKRFLGQRIVQLVFGGQHAAMLCVPGEPIPPPQPAAGPEASAPAGAAS